MDFKTVAACVLVAITIAFVLATLESMFSGRTGRMLRSAGFSVVITAATIFMIRQSFALPVSRLKSLGWIIQAPGSFLLMMYVVGGTLVVLGVLSGQMVPMRMQWSLRSSRPIIGEKRQYLTGTMLRRRMHSFGRRIASRQPADLANGLKQNND